MARPASDIRARLLVAARKRFLVDGVDGASLRTIAKEARTNVGMVVYWFATKDDLFLATVEEVYAKLVADLETILAADTTVRARLERAFARLGHASDLEVDTLRLVVREALLTPPSPRFERLLGRFREGHVSMVARVLAEGVERGELDASIPFPLLLVSTFGVGAAPQIGRRLVRGALPFASLPDPDTLGALAVARLFHGIAAPLAPAQNGLAPAQKGARSRARKTRGRAKGK
ncbi:MAG: TetR/AcrR family transcriptional regulator [Deltaproteobacteria bacterium]|nr:TetR/AcrR family transcriptional regulator [Deltaproteobacteria bacterium]